MFSRNVNSKQHSVVVCFFWKRFLWRLKSRRLPLIPKKNSLMKPLLRAFHLAVTFLLFTFLPKPIVFTFSPFLTTFDFFKP